MIPYRIKFVGNLLGQNSSSGKLFNRLNAMCISEFTVYLYVTSFIHTIY